LLSLIVLPLGTSGCAVFGYVASVLPSAPVKARYPGLMGQKVAVFTWVDRASTYDFPMLAADVTTQVQNKLRQAAAPEAKVEELAGTTFVDARQIVRWQKNHPELEMRSVTELATMAAAALGCTRVIYLEIQPFGIHDPRTSLLLKGYASVTIRVAEVNGGVAKSAYEETGLEINFPSSSPEGVPATDSITPAYIYHGLVDRMTTDISVRFFTTTEEEQPK
jgi:hypothetical protein